MGCGGSPQRDGRCEGLGATQRRRRRQRPGAPPGSRGGGPAGRAPTPRAAHAAAALLPRRPPGQPAPRGPAKRTSAFSVGTRLTLTLSSGSITSLYTTSWRGGGGAATGGHVVGRVEGSAALLAAAVRRRRRRRRCRCSTPSPPLPVAAHLPVHRHLLPAKGVQEGVAVLAVLDGHKALGGCAGQAWSRRARVGAAGAGIEARAQAGGSGSSSRAALQQCQGAAGRHSCCTSVQRCRVQPGGVQQAHGCAPSPLAALALPGNSGATASEVASCSACRRLGSPAQQKFDGFSAASAAQQAAAERKLKRRMSVQDQRRRAAAGGSGGGGSTTAVATIRHQDRIPWVCKIGCSPACAAQTTCRAAGRGRQGPAACNQGRRR